MVQSRGILGEDAFGRKTPESVAESSLGRPDGIRKVNVGNSEAEAIHRVISGVANTNSFSPS